MSIRSMAEIVRDQDPLILSPDTTVKHACHAMRERRVGAVLVAGEDRKLLGIFTGRDAVCRVAAEGLDSAKLTLAAVMSRRPHTIRPGQSAVDALQLMTDSGVRHLPIVDGDKILGIVSHGDFRGLEMARQDERTGLWERL